MKEEIRNIIKIMEKRNEDKEIEWQQHQVWNIGKIKDGVVK